MTAYNFTLITAKPHWSAGDLQAITAYYDLAGTALANGDTITATGMIPGDGVKIYDIYTFHTELDSNATPTGTYNVGDANSAARFMSSVPMGINGVTTSGFQITNRSNFAPTSTNGVVTTGLGYIYTGTTATDLILTVNAAVATGTTTGVVFLVVLYRCVGNS